MNAPEPTGPLRATDCPLCGGPNACQPALAGRWDVPCWCQTAAFGAELLARVPEDPRGRRCVCAACAAGGCIR